jgi:hypothetical protein
MRSGIGVVSLCLVALVLVSGNFAFSQDGDPPPCCDKAPVIGGTVDQDGIVPIQSVVLMPDAALSSAGLTRTQFIDMIAAGLMPGKQVTLIFSVTDTIKSPELTATLLAAGVPPEQVQVVRQYRVPRSQMKADDIDGIDQVIVTDGVTEIKVSFSAVQQTSAAH